jgi:RNA polymerase sporulation-specific sigma factor
MDEPVKKLSLCELSDEEVAVLARDGDSAAVEEIFSRYHSLVSYKIKPYFLAGAERDDIIQEGMIGLYQAICNYRSEYTASFKTFAGICISRKILSAVKSAARQKHIPLNSYVSLSASAGDDSEDEFFFREEANPENIVISRESLDKMERSISGALSKLELQVLVYYLAGHSYQEISELIDKDIKSVDNAVQRMKKKLEAVLKQTE